MSGVGEVDTDSKDSNKEDWVRKWRDWLIHFHSFPDSQHMTNIDVTTGRMNGIIKNGEEVIEVKERDCKLELIIGNLKSHSTRVQRNGGEVDLSECKEDILDLSADGRRWEGTIHENLPFGYGCLYNEDNELVFEGWLINETKVCYGIEYWSDTGAVKYEGCLYEGMKHGYGVLYNRLGSVEYSGFFNNDSPIIPNKELTLENDSPFPFLHSHLESLVIGDEYNPKITSLLIHDCYALNQITFGSYCFPYVESFELKRMFE